VLFLGAPAPIFDFASFSFQVPICGLSAANATIAARTHPTIADANCLDVMLSSGNRVETYGRGRILPRRAIERILREAQVLDDSAADQMFLRRN
jgi:hypothetical protein